MARPYVICMLTFPLAGCGDTHSFDFNIPLMYPDNPAVIRLPYEQTLDKGGLRLSIRAIPGRVDAVRVLAKYYGSHDSAEFNSVQEGCSTKKILLNSGLVRYDFDFHELRPSGGAVAEVKLSVIARSKSGPR